ncbi:helix-turn-helix transcriptional regulator [Corallococcus aberystwythensis]|nr:LuxR C-terminal-related transcriptional regulator [Corallococcus aberystwythensis]
MALCLMHVEPFDFQWHVPGPPVPILDGYAELAQHDFLREPILKRPNVPIRDTQLLTRDAYERTLIYQRSRELDPPLEHIMAVLLPIRPGLVGALAFYRTLRRPFSSGNASALSSLNEHLMNMVRNCSDFQTTATGARLLEVLYNRPDTGFIVVEPPSRIELRSPRADGLLEKWFARSDFDSCGLPEIFKAQLNALVRMDADSRLDNNVWISLHGDTYRTVRFVEMPAPDGPRQWALIMNEIPTSIPLPAQMKLQLTPRQVDIAKYLLRNRSNKQIAEESGLSFHTVKTHVRDIFNELKVDDRADFLYQAARLNKPV